MTSTILLILIFVVILILVGFLVYRFTLDKKNPAAEPKKYDHRSFFIVGIVLFGSGITLLIFTGKFFYISMAVIGFTYLMISLANRDKWKD
jgi:uncharacterized membrane protein SirB2